MNNPKARREGLFSERLAEETVIYDKANHTAHTLNQTVATIWESADGDKSVNELARLLHSQLGIPADPGVVLLALEQLQAAGLLEPCQEVEKETERTSRREVARRLALAGVSAAMVPLVASVVAPTPAMAASMVIPE
jgi:Coenzyme PQQ synthesis protein D (PqqD)